ncbi:replicase [Cactus tobamovirus 2]|nr:replicase [Cactus tobamovirus 2]
MAQLQNYVNKINAGAGQSAQHLLTNLAERVVYDQALESTESQKRRPKYHFNKVLTPEQQTLVTSAYPEFNIIFTGTSLSVHAVAGGLRGLELELLMTLVPFRAACYDIGGNYVRHMLKGRDYVHCCNPQLSVRDGARYEGYRDELRKLNYKDSAPVGCWGSLCGSSSFKARSLLPHQTGAFERYANYRQAVVCDDTFQECHFPPPPTGVTYAVLLHSIYDIPVDELGPALLRKNVHVAYAAFHLVEEMLWKDVDGIYAANDIDALFERHGDRLTFRFRDEATVCYEHSYRNVVGHALKTFYPAGQGKVYFKEFMCRRAGTVFAKFTLVDTAHLHKSAFHKSVDGSQFIDAMDEAFEIKREVALFKAERLMLRDKATIALWFPNAHNKVCVPVFRGSIAGKKKIQQTTILVDRDFFYVVFNHIMGYQDKNVSFQCINNFVESVASRVVINGTSVRPEWTIDREIIADLSLTLLFMVQLRKMQNRVVQDKIPLHDDNFWSALKSGWCSFLDSVWPNLLEFCRNRGLLTVIENKLVVTTPTEFVTFDDFLIMEYTKSAQPEDVPVDELIASSDKLYDTVSHLASTFPSLSVDINTFRSFCNTEKVSADLVGKVFEALINKKLGLSVTGPDDTVTNLVEACKPRKLDDAIAVVSKQGTDTPFHDAAESGRLNLPLSGESASEHNFWFRDDDDNIVDLEDFHLLDAEHLAKPQNMAVFYKGTLKQQQMLNYLDYLAASLCATVNNLKLALKQWWAGDKRNPKDIGVFDCKRGKWLTEPGKKTHTWGVAQTDDLKFKVVMLNYVDDKPVCNPDWKSVAVSSETKVFSAMKMLHNLRLTLRDGTPHEPKCRSCLVDGVPGCGKTAEILKRCDFSTDLVLTPTREAAQMIRRRANSSQKVCIASTENVRTIDSFVMNCKPRVYKTLWIDEGLMCHPGLIWFCALLSGCEELFVFGDRFQIPFIPRVDNFGWPDCLKPLVVDEIESRQVTHRCPVDVTAWLSKIYKKPVTTTSEVDISVNAKLVAGKASFDPRSLPLPGKIITFTQAEKQDLIKAGYNDVTVVEDVTKLDSTVNTVHEIQGETYPVTSIVRINPHPISIIGSASAHSIVALSRHTQHCTYYTVVADSLLHTINEIRSLAPFFFDLYKSPRTQL